MANEIDRNQQAREKFQAAQQTAAIKRAREQFAGDFQFGRASVLDRFGVTVREGDLVVFKMPHDPIMTVVSVSPSMDPNHPVGAIKVLLACEVPVMFGANQPSPAMIRVGAGKQVASAAAEVPRDVQSPEVDDPVAVGDAFDPNDPNDKGDPGDPDG